jgi:hypothetical protein
MLRKLSMQVQACFDRALDAKRKADGTADPARKAEFRQFEKSWLALAESYEITERLTDFTAENAGWQRRFNERRRVGARQDDEVRLQRFIQEGNVEALFERMWLSSIVEFSDDAIISKKPRWHHHKLEQRGGAALWLFGPARDAEHDKRREWPGATRLAR